MYAIIETGGKQYRVKNGDQIVVEKLNVADGEKVVFDKVLVVGEGADVKVGAPYVEGTTVEGKAIETGKGKKVIIFKYKAKKDYRKKQGHRQPYTLVEITAIGDIEGVDRDALLLILKTLLVAYLTSFGCDICTDAGEKAIATALETAGKALMLSMAVPMLVGIFASVRYIIGG